jgi:hypothetical protein
MKLNKTVKLLLVGAAFCTTSTVFALPDISGHWKCQGHDPFQNKTMAASGEIKKTGETYSLMNWKDEGSNDERSGTGLHNDKLKDSFAVMFWSNNNAENTGFGLYQIQSKDKIVGTWTMKNGKVTAQETCERVKA